MINVPKMYGSRVFGDEEMKKRLPSEVYEKLKKSIDENIAVEKNPSLDGRNIVLILAPSAS